MKSEYRSSFWLQITKSMIRRAENSGFSAIVLTVDCQVFGQLLANVRNQFSLPSHLTEANFQSWAEERGVDGGGDFYKSFESLYDPSLSWEDVKWLKHFTKLPIILKGKFIAYIISRPAGE